LSSIRVLKIDKDKVSLEWKPSEIDIAKITTISKIEPDNRVDIDRANGIIVFTLHANQTFSSYTMQVLEGKVKSVTIRNTVADKNAPAASPLEVTPKNAENHADTAPATKSQEGLSGLINSYKNLDQYSP
jgi:hypothetical protein